MKKLIINADDFGISPEANAAILELLLERKLSSTSLMANGPSFDQAKTFIEKYGLKDIGVHLAVTRDGFDVEKPLVYQSLSKRKSLTDAEGNLPTSIVDLRECTFSDLTHEIEMQFTKLLNNGIAFTHIDNHMYSVFPRLGMKGYLSVFAAYRRIWDGKTKRGIRLTRKVQYVPSMFEIWAGRKLTPLLLLCASKKKLCPIDYCYSFPFNPEKLLTLEEKKAFFRDFLYKLPDGVTELHIHPCKDSEHLRQYNPTWQHRVHEYQMLREMDLDELLEENKITLITYRELCN